MQEGYPKSRFTYDTFKDNTDMMITDSDKNTCIMYELQGTSGLLSKDEVVRCRYSKRRGGNVSKYGRAPPFEETINFIKRIKEYMGMDLTTGL